MRHPLFLSLTTALLTPALLAQPRPAPQTANPGVVELAEAPFKIESVGFSMQVPVGSRTESSFSGLEAKGMIYAPDQKWVIVLLSFPSPSIEASPQSLMKLQIDQLLKAPGATLLDHNDALVVGNSPACRAYVHIPQSNGQPATVHGLTVLKSSPTAFAVFEMTTSEVDFAKSRPTYETIVATATFTDPSQLQAARKAVIDAGLKVIGALTDSEYREAIAMAPERWERLYRPAPSGADADAQEIAYRRVKAWAGSRGELTPGRSPAAFTVSEQQKGYLVRIDARFRQGQGLADIQGLFFMTPDRKDEAWTVSTTRREGKETQTYTETGARSGTDMQIKVQQEGATSRSLKPLLQGEGYITRVEAYILPQLLLRAKARGEFGFYTWQSDLGKIVLRRDTMTQPAGKPDLWKLSTRLHEDAPPQTALLSSKGQVLRTELGDGSLWEPTDLNRLTQLWKSKGLPLE